MGDINEAQRKWLQGLGVDTSVAGAAPGGALTTASGPSPSGAPGDDWAFSPLKPQPLNLNIDPATLQNIINDKNERDKKEAEQKLARVNKAILDVRAYIAEMPSEELQKSGYVKIMKDVRDRFPEVAGMSQWVKDTARTVPSLKGKLPSSKALMDAVESGVTSRFANMTWGLSTNQNPDTVNTDRLLAAYLSEMPSGVSVEIKNGVVQLSLQGTALAVPVAGGEVDASADKGGAKVVLKNDDFNIQVSNEGWKEFDPELRGRWQSIGDDASTVVSLKADRDKAKLELEKQKKGGEEISADLTTDFEKREAAFNLAWKNLQERVNITATASEEKVTASVVYLKQDAKDKGSVKAGVEAEVDLKAMQGKLKAYYENPTINAVLEVAAAADKVSAKLELTAVKSGVVVTVDFEKALDETNAAIEVMLRDSKTKIAGELKKKADDLTAKLKVVHETKDLKLAAELEKTLKNVRGSIEVEYTKGATTVKGGANVSSKGEAGGKVQVDIALKDGRAFQSKGDKLSFTANVSNKKYKFEVAFSMGEPVETASLQDLFSSADQQIKELYKLAGDKGVRSIQDAKALNDKLQEVMEPIKAAADKAKTLKSKSAIAASFGFSIEGDWPVGGRAMPPVASVGAKITF